MFKSLRAKMNLGDAGLMAGVVKKASHLRADLLDQLDGRLSGVAKKLNLATRAELKALKRQIRELENQVENLERQLSSERRRADEAETALSEASKANKKANQAAQKADEELAQKKASLEATARDLEAREKALAERAAALDKVEAEASPKDADKPTTKKGARAKKKTDAGDLLERAETSASDDAEEPASPQA